ncbi:hypothetical protein [Vibrio rumoiensis]|uniref:hypothetical protein n=1 Tax=Vibrio rumoiensis TaxID=76258 RepID=UPI0003122A02|nr:hypothetical protein [Vibrio rumoiensis]
MKALLILAVAAFVILSIYTEGLVSALAELAAFATVIAWVLKSKSVVKRKHEAQIEPHV